MEDGGTLYQGIRGREALHQSDQRSLCLWHTYLNWRYTILLLCKFTIAEVKDKKLAHRVHRHCPMRIATARLAFTLLLATCLGVLQPVTALAWLYPEHRDITVLAIQRLEPAARAVLEQLWAEARTGHEA